MSLDDLLTQAPSPWMLKTEVADYLRCDPHTVESWVRAGRLTRYYVAGFRSVRFKRAEVEALVQPTPPAPRQGVENTAPGPKR